PSSQWRETSFRQMRGINGMATSVNPAVIASVGTGWESVGGQLLASAALLLSGYQDRPGKGSFGFLRATGADFGFFMALASSISALVTAIWVKLWAVGAICTGVLCAETFLIRRWNQWTSV